MLGTTAGMVVTAPGLSGRSVVLAAAVSSVLWRAVRGLAGQSQRRLCPAEASFPLRVPEADEAARAILENSRAPPPIRRFIACPDLARTVVSRLHNNSVLEPTGRRPAIVVECEPDDKCENPNVQDSGSLVFNTTKTLAYLCIIFTTLLEEMQTGPGILTRTLLNAGSQVIALESNNAFLPDLESLKRKLDGQLEVLHCDFFRLDPVGLGSMRPPVMYSERLLENLGILPVPWTADIPLKVVGIVPQKRERNLLWKLIYSLYERDSVYKYGRIELNLFVSEKEYKTLVAKPGEPRIYQPLSVLWQTACDVQLLHMEPWSSFLTNSRNGRLSIPKSVLLQNDHLCLVRMTPRKNLFTDSLTTTNSRIFILMVKQCLAKCRTKLVDKLNLWSFESGKKLLRQIEIPEDITTGSLYPEEYKCLFEAMEQSNEFHQSWLFEDSLEDNSAINF